MPELWAENAWILRAFFELSATRPAGLAVGYITFAEIESYARIHDVEDVPTFAARIRALDIVYLEAQREKANAKSQR